MSGFLERYLAGEHEQVWDDLVALGPAVREEPVYTDALAVAHETMRRVRDNIEILLDRLPGAGYEFGYGWLEPRWASFARGQPPSYSPPPADTASRIAELEERIGPLPLSLRAFYELVGSVNLVGSIPSDWSIDERADPLLVYPLDTVFWELGEWREERAQWETGASNQNPGPFAAPIAPDYLHKYNISGGMWYHVVLPNPCADAILEAEGHATTFVNYLRIALRWAGFPGLECKAQRPEKEPTFLTDGLLPI